MCCTALKNIRDARLRRLGERLTTGKVGIHFMYTSGPSPTTRSRVLGPRRGQKGPEMGPNWIQNGFQGREHATPYAVGASSEGERGVWTGGEWNISPHPSPHDKKKQ